MPLVIGLLMWMYSALSTLNTTTEVPLSKAPNPQLLPGRRSINGCPLLRVWVHGVCVFTAVCVHLDGLFAEHKFRVWVTILMSLHFHFTLSLSLYLKFREASFLSLLVLQIESPESTYAYLLLIHGKTSTAACL